MDTNLLDQTRSHYDSFPFIEGGANRIAWWREYLRAFLPDREIQDRLVLDVGSSVGEISRGMIDRGARLICLDLSFESLRRCRRVNPEAELLHASALDLPFADNTFDHSIAIGVLHHTPDCRRGFRETARVVAPGGTVLVFLYNTWSIYNLIYHGFKPIRRTLPLSQIPSWALRMLQPFVWLHLRQTLNGVQLRNLLGRQALDTAGQFPLGLGSSAVGRGGRPGIRDRQELLLGLRECRAIQEGDAMTSFAGQTNSWGISTSARGSVLLRVRLGPLVSWCHRSRQRLAFSVPPGK